MSPPVYHQLPGGHYRDAYSNKSMLRKRPLVGTIIAIVLLFGLLSYIIDAPIPIIKDKSWRPDKNMNEWLHSTKQGTTNVTRPLSTATQSNHRQAYLQHANGERSRAKIAFATILTGAGDEKDPYFLSTRVLCYQLLHAKETKNAYGAPCVVLATPNVPQSNMDRLRKDGAVVIPITSIQSTWAQTNISTWTDMFSKLHLFELTQYDIVVFMDNDVVLQKRIDDIFEDPAVMVQSTRDNPSKMIGKAKQPPSSYLFAGLPELKRDHHYPPTLQTDDFPNIGYLNAGFFIFRPSKGMFDYLMSVLEVPNSFNPALMEQNLLNEVFRTDGNMPWTHMDSKWNIHYPKHSDVEGGAVSVHDKFWFPHNHDMSELLLSWRWRMHGFYERFDEDKM